jgi:hypothetical protein
MITHVPLLDYISIGEPNSVSIANSPSISIEPLLYLLSTVRCLTFIAVGSLVVWYR